MMMCNECKGAFEEPDYIEEPHNEITGCPSEYFKVCPFCGSDDFDKMHKCGICGEWIPSNKDYCQHCIDNGAIAIKMVTKLLGVSADMALDLMEYAREME